MATGYRLREDRQPLAMGGFDYGMTNVAPRLVRPRYAKKLRNVFFKDGIRSRYGWTTLTDGMGTSINFTWDDTTVDAGRLRGFISFNSGKIAVFEKMVLWDSDYTSEDFNGGGTVASVAGQDLVGCFQWASLFYVFSLEKMYRVNFKAITAVVAAPTAAGTGYTVGDILRVTTGGTSATVRVATISGGGTTGPVATIALVEGGYNYTTGTGKVTNGGTGSGCTIEVTTVAAGGTLTEAVDFSTDIGLEYDQVIQMFSRFGKIWAVSSLNSRVFWCDDAGVDPEVGATVPQQYIDPANYLTYQSLWSGKIQGSPLVEMMKFYDISCEQIMEYHYSINSLLGYPAPSYPSWVCQRGSVNLLVSKEAYDALIGVTTPTVYIRQANTGTRGNVRLVNTITTKVLHTVLFNASAGVGTKYAKVAWTGGHIDRSWKSGERVTISDATHSESNIVDYIDITDAAGMRIYFINALAYTYVLGTAEVTSDEIYTVTLGSAWDSNVQWDYGDVNFLSTENWITATATTQYLIVLDPDNDPNDDINGHIKLLSVGHMMFAYAVRVTFTKDINYWTEDNAGYYDIADNKGTIVETVETEAGLYVFKQNPGAIYLLQGEPGPEATPGTLQLKFIHGGLTAVPGTIQATMGGVYFSTFEQDKIKTYFLPLTSNEVTEIPKLGEHYNPDIANIGNPAYTFTCKSCIVHADNYLLTVSSQAAGVGVPSDTVKAYLCQAFYDSNMWQGRWAYWDEDQAEEYVADNPTATIPGRAKTLGYYMFGAHLYRVYCVKDDAGTYEYNYYIARYCQANGRETALDKIYMLRLIGAAYSNVTYDSGFYMDIGGGAVGISGVDQFKVSGIRFAIECTEGQAIISFYKNLAVTAFLTKTITGLEEDAGSESFLRQLDLNFNCQYIQFLIRFSGVHSAGTEEHMLYRDVELQVAYKTSKGNIPQAAGD